MKWLARLGAGSLAVLAVLALLTDWIPWWVSLLLASPLVLLVFLNTVDDVGWIGEGDGFFHGGGGDG